MFALQAENANEEGATAAPAVKKRAKGPFIKDVCTKGWRGGLAQKQT